MSGAQSEPDERKPDPRNRSGSDAAGDDARARRRSVFAGLGPNRPAIVETGLWALALVILFRFDETGTLNRISAGLLVSIVLFSFVAITGNPRAAARITGLAAASIAAISWTKMDYLGVPFVINDAFYLTGPSLTATLVQYKGVALAGGAGLFAVAFLIVASVWRAERVISALMRGCALVLVTAFAFKLPEAAKVAYIWDPAAERASGAVSSFANSLVARITRGGDAVSFANVGESGLAGRPIGARPAPAAAGAADRPDIVMILDESVFDPRDLDLPVEANLDGFFAPADGISGRLNVNVHGGGTWVSEFAAATGLDTRSFGDQAYYLPVLMAGRVKHSLMLHLKSLGYETVVVYCMNGSFMNAENNYAALGADRFDGLEDEHVPGIVWINRDRDFYQRALDHIDRVRRTTEKPVFALVVTIYNHGPHVEEPAVAGDRDAARAFLDHAAPGSENASYRDYYLRLQHNMGDYRWLKREYASRFPERSLVVGHYGDHQPKFTREMMGDTRRADPAALYRTRFAIEAVNRPLAPVPSWGGGPLDIAYLPGLVLAAAGLERDAIFAARLDLMQRCQGLYAACRDPLKGRIHRTLIDEGLVDVDRILEEDPLNLAQNLP